MSTFTSILLVSPLADGNTWVVMREFDFVLGDSGGAPIAVPMGFETDFASIPRPFWAILPKWGKYGNAAVVHDWLYWSQSEGSTRAQADSALRDGMITLHVSPLQREPIYWAVRLFGWLAWYRNRADKAAGYQRVLAQLPTDAGARTQRRGQYSRIMRHLVGNRTL